jgi:hypothetical protein
MAESDDQCAYAFSFHYKERATQTICFVHF